MTDTRWTPDPMLVDAARNGRLHATQMTEPDRAYVIARLSDDGETAEQIADRLHCSVRLVKRIRAEPLTVTMQRAHHAEEALADATTRLGKATRGKDAHSRAQAAETARLRAQIDQLVDDLRRTRQALDHERAQRHRHPNVHLHVYRRSPTSHQQQSEPKLF